MNPPKRMDSYLRVSRVGERAGQDSYGSPDDQRDAIERWANYKAVEIVREHLDEDESGGTQERPGLETAIARALSGETDGIVCFDISRFSRFTEGGLRDLRRLKEAGARLVFATEEIDTSTVHGRMVYTILLATYEAALEQYKARWRVTKARGIREGRQIGPTPVGYTRERGHHGRLVPHPTAGPAITRAYELAADGDLAAAAAHLRREVPTTARTARKRATAERYGVKLGERVEIPATWNEATVRRVLGRRVYLGHAYYGDEIATNRDAHPPLTGLATWTAAQSSAEDRRAPAADFPLSGGHARCASCGGRLSGSRGGSKARGDYQRRYKCIRRECQAKANVGADLLEPMALELLAQLPHSPDPGGSDPVGAAGAAHEAMVTAERRLEAWRLDDAQREALGADAHAAVAATYAAELEQARVRFEALVREALLIGRPDPSEIAEASARELPDLLRRLGLIVSVAKGRGNLSERVALEPRSEASR